jgi:hypothetical protein
MTQQLQQAHLGAWPTPREGNTTSEDMATWQIRADAGKVATPPLGALIAGWPTPRERDANSQDGLEGWRLRQARKLKEGINLQKPIRILLMENQEMSACGSLRQAYHASPHHAQGSREERLMTAGSGRVLCESFPKSGPLGRCSRILLESETWASPEFSLRWKVAATKCGCSIFRLAPSVRRTAGQDTGSSAAGWMTPSANEDAAGKAKPPGELGMQQMLAHQVKATWPTPAARDGDPRSPQAKRLTEQGKSNLDDTLAAASGATPSSCLALTEKFAVRLMILSAWLMGYPWSYLKNWERKGDRRRKTAIRPAISSPPSAIA